MCDVGLRRTLCECGGASCARRAKKAEAAGYVVSGPAHARVQPPTMHALAPDVPPGLTLAPAAEEKEEEEEAEERTSHAAAASVGGTDEVNVQPFEARALFLHIRTPEATLSTSSVPSSPSSFLPPTPTDGGSAASTEPCRYVSCLRRDHHHRHARRPV